ncbi:MAG: hydrogenase nickel incorporation protein HypA [Nitrososphaerales archaeon]|nr:hydrogenase nickel incorporation protein HypA [Nitrososphaerales archaeon]
MHEWALAEAVIEAAREERAKRELKDFSSLEVFVTLGELRQIDRQLFLNALRELSKTAFKEGVKFRIKMEKARLECLSCHNRWSLKDALKRLMPEEAESIHFIPETAHVYLKCPRCQSRDFKIVSGREVWISRIRASKPKGE